MRRPRTWEGMQAWGLVTRSINLWRRATVMSDAGFDFPSMLLAAEAADISPDIIVRLLPSIEAGILTAIEPRADKADKADNGTD